MSTTYFVDFVDITIKHGSVINDVAGEVVQLAKDLQCEVRFTFNGREFVVTSNTSEDSIIERITE